MPQWLLTLLITVAVSGIFGSGGYVALLIARSRNKLDQEHNTATDALAFLDRKDKEIARIDHDLKIEREERLRLTAQWNDERLRLSTQVQQLQQQQIADAQSKNALQMQVTFMQNLYQQIYEQNVKQQAEINVLRKAAGLSEESMNTAAAAVVTFPLPTLLPGIMPQVQQTEQIGRAKPVPVEKGDEKTAR